MKPMLFRHLRLSRWLDDGREPRNTDSAESQRFRTVDAALRSSAPLDSPSPFLRTRILARLESPRAQDRSLPRWLPIAMAAACALAVVGSITLARLMGESGTPPSPIVAADAGATSGAARSPSELFDDLRRRRDLAAKAIDDPIRREAALLLADTRRMADLVLSRLPLEHVTRLTPP